MRTVDRTLLTPAHRTRALLLTLACGLLGGCLTTNSPTPPTQPRPTPNASADAGPTGGIQADGVVLLAFANSTPVSTADVVCSATLASGLIITAAHCIRPNEHLRAFLDPVNLCNGSAGTGEVLTEAWTIATPDRDVAFTPAPRARKWAKKSAATHNAPQPEAGRWAVTGWGTEPGQAPRCTSRTLQLTPTRGCQSSRPDTWCATSQTGNTCTGDSGAGVINGVGDLVAVTSTGTSCAPGAPGSYALLDGLTMPPPTPSPQRTAVDR